MEYKTINCSSYNLHLIKTDRFKTIHLEIIFRSKADKEKLQKRTLLADILTYSSKKYPSRKDIVIKSEDLYNIMLYGNTSKTGDIINTIFVSDFIDPNFINESDYYENSLGFLFEVLMHPLVNNKEFDLKTFSLAKDRLKIDIESVNENPVRKSIKYTLKNAFPNNPISYPIIGELDTLDDITTSNLYDEYIDMINNDICDIFMIGNIDEYKTEKIINKYFKLKTIKTNELGLYIPIDKRRKAYLASSEDEFMQASLNLIYNVGNLDEYNKHIVFNVFNYILGNGGMRSKLYQNVREKNSLCYSISSMYMKYYGALLIQVSLENENVNKAISLIKKSIKDIIRGDISDDELIDAKINMMNALEMLQDNNISILNNYVFQVLYNLPSIEKRKQLIKNVTKEDIINIAKKLQLNTIYCLKGGAHEEN